MSISLDSADAVELAELLQFLDNWLATNSGPVYQSLTRLVGCEAYGPGSLRDDIARFIFLPGESDGEGLFSPRPPAKRTHRDSGPDDRQHREFIVRNLQSG